MRRATFVIWHHKLRGSSVSSIPPPTQEAAQTRVGHSLLIKINEIWAPTRTCHYTKRHLHQRSDASGLKASGGGRVRVRVHVLINLPR